MQKGVQKEGVQGGGSNMCKGPLVGGVARRSTWPKQRMTEGCQQCKWLDPACLISPEGECGFGFKGGRVVSSGLA